MKGFIQMTDKQESSKKKKALDWLLVLTFDDNGDMHPMMVASWVILKSLSSHLLHQLNQNRAHAPYYAIEVCPHVREGWCTNKKICSFIHIKKHCYIHLHRHPYHGIYIKLPNLQIHCLDYCSSQGQ
jgi:hypothetical protein